MCIRDSIFAHYEDTMDEKYLRETAYPIMKKSAEFYCAYLVEDKDGYLCLLYTSCGDPLSEQCG